jgi:tRNA/tmRNA/rRNA uracil-C5-methylase (TrmA/RlmC/RlmD family)
MDIDVVSSSKMYFSSPSVRRHYAPSRDLRRDSYDIDDDDDDDDEFYRVVIPSSIVGWRTQAKLAIAPKSLWSRSSGCVVGLYQRNSHDVIGIPECRVHHPSVNRAVEVLTQATANVRTPAYNEDTGEGLLRYAMVRVETHTGKVCMTLVMNADKYKDAQPQLSQLAKEMRNIDRDLFHSIWCHCNDAKGNVIFAKDVTRWHPVDGMPYLRERIPGSSGVVSGAKYGTRDDNEIEAGEEEEEDGGYLYFSPHVFRQANMDGFADIAREVREAIPSGSKVCELYAGVGLLGLSALLHHGRMDSEVGGGGGGLGWLRCSDENPENAKCFERSVNSMPSRITGRSPRTGRMFRGVGDGRGGRGGRHARMQRRGGGAGRTASSAADGGGDLLSIKDLMDSVLSDGGDGRRRAAAPPSEVEPSERVTYMQASAASALYRGQALGANVLIVDPPRKGLDEVVLQQLSQRINPNQMYAEESTLISHLPRHTVNWTNDVRSLIYVSCGFDALARDLDALLTSNAGWKLESATGYVLFPGSNHVETVVVLRR